MSENGTGQRDWDHTVYWQRQCRRRLQENPHDLDALFAKAAWLAKTQEFEKRIETLETITKRDPFYPGIWMLKAKIYRQLGNEKMARLCLERAEEQSR
jgi:tetratricopeptide (TPR) repeat protein